VWQRRSPFEDPSGYAAAIAIAFRRLSILR
jgi:hypothetical protein